jgi:prevent-host-death family protein
VSATEFKDRCLELMDAVRDRKFEVLVTKHGRPAALLVAPDDTASTPFGYLRGMLVSDDGLMDAEPEEWGDLA